MAVGSFFLEESVSARRWTCDTTYEIQVRHGIFELKRQHIICKRHEEQWPLAHIGFTQDARLFKQLVGGQSAAGHPENGEFMFNFAVASNTFYLVYLQC